MARVRKIVTRVSTTDEDYCLGATMRRKTTSAGKSSPRSIVSVMLFPAGKKSRSSREIVNLRISKTLSLSGDPPQPVVSHRGTASRATLVLICSRKQRAGYRHPPDGPGVFQGHTRVRPDRRGSSRVPVRQENRYRFFHQQRGGQPIQRSGYGKRRTFLLRAGDVLFFRLDHLVNIRLGHIMK